MSSRSYYSDMGAHSPTSKDLNTWGKLADYLLAVEHAKTWEHTHPSFSAWLFDEATRLKRNPSSLWRARSSGRYYRTLAALLNARGHQVPDLDSDELKASAESLELAAKLSRVAPEELMGELAAKVIDATVSRRDLRSYWLAYRPVMAGKTARGRGTVPPRFDPHDAHMRISRAEADVIASLIQAGAEWLGNAAARAYRVFHFEDFPKYLQPKGMLPDVLILYQPDEHAPVEIHGVEIVPPHVMHSQSLEARIQRIRSAVDYTWLALLDPVSTDRKPEEVRDIGQIHAGHGGVRVRCRARRGTPDPANQADLLKVLLSRLLTD